MAYPSVPPRNKAQDQLTMDYAKDPWGFIDEKFMAELHNSDNYEQYGPDNWSLTQIRTPLGSTINVEYEEDDYYMEAFSRKYWQDNLQIAVSTDHTKDSEGYMYFHIKNMDGLLENLNTNFSNYFTTGEKVFFDLWLIRTHKDGFFSKTSIGGVDLPSNYDFEVIVEEVSEDFLLLKVYRSQLNPPEFCAPQEGFQPPKCDTPSVIHYAWDEMSPLKYFAKKDGVGTNIYESKPRGEYIETAGVGSNRHVMVYKLLANKVDKDLAGGGLRVKSITLEDAMGNQYKTNYYYNKPGTNKDPEHNHYVSSGITSFAPERGLKFIPYQPELPSPGVMYEHVTMEPFGVDGNSMGKTQYEFFVLQPLFDIFNPNLEMKDTNGIPIFESEVFDFGGGDMWVPDQNAYAKQVNLKVNTSHIGQFKSVSQYNRFGHLISKTTNNYVSGEAVKAIDGRGSIRESFQTMKSVFNSFGIFNGLKKRLISISSKEEFSSVLQSVNTVSKSFETTETYFDPDPNIGTFRVTETTRADGTKIRTSKLPAYHKYPTMGSKVDNPGNKNMLAQQAMAITEIQDVNEDWQKISSNITTWKPEVYEVELNQYDVWRKHKTFTWNGTTDTQGYFTNYNGDDDGFDWSDPESTQPSQWKQLSEVTRYNDFSNPLEIKDINGNLTATKMGYKDSKTLMTCNAGYNESFYSGAEDHDGQGNFGGGVTKGTATLTTDAHTGTHALSISENQNGYHVTAEHEDAEPKKFKISLWAKTDNAGSVQLNVGGNTINFNPAEIIRAGDWTLLNFYADIETDTPVNVASASGTVIVDDFRLHPISSTMNSYVYNEWDELTDILGPNNLATKYEYDAAGRLVRIYSEIQNVDQVLPGGFKKVREYAYTYKYGDFDPSEDEEEVYDDLYFSGLGVDDHFSGPANVTAYVSGGSGVYEYQWSLKYCQDPEQPDPNICPGDLQPAYGGWSQQNSIPIHTYCHGTRAVYWCRVRDLQTNEIVENQGNHKRKGCNGNDGGGGEQE